MPGETQTGSSPSWPVALSRNLRTEDETVAALACMHVCSVAWYCSPPGSSDHGILQTRMLEWVAMLSSRVSSRPRDRTHISHVFCIGKWVLYTSATWKALQTSDKKADHSQPQSLSWIADTDWHGVSGCGLVICLCTYPWPDWLRGAEKLAGYFVGDVIQSSLLLPHQQAVFQVASWISEQEWWA